MHVTLRPATRQFIDEQVKTGRFPSPEAVIEEAIAQLQVSDDLDDRTIAAINEAEDQADRGEGRDLDTFRADFHRRLLRA
jgi:putative addiction module CopG family antidote